MSRGLAASGQTHLSRRIGELHISKSRHAALFCGSNDGYLLAIPFQFFSQHSLQRLFQWLMLVSNMRSQRLIRIIRSLAMSGSENFSDARRTKPQNIVLRVNSPLNQFSIDINFGTIMLNPNLTFDNI
jgi:hypothetical protein